MSIPKHPEGLDVGPAPRGGRYSWVAVAVLTVATLIVGVACGYLLRSVTEHSTRATQTITRTFSAGPPVGSPSSAATTPAGMGYGPATAPVDRPATERAVLTGARAWHDPEVGQDVVELAFASAAPACVARYVPVPTGEKVSGAAAFLQFRCPGVSQIALTSTSQDTGSALEPGQRRLRSPTTKNVIEVVQTGYENHVLTWIIGLRRKAPLGVALFQSTPTWVSIYIMS